MSRNSRTRLINGAGGVLPAAASDNEDNLPMVDCAIALYGGNAPTAVACCALEAWCDGDQDEYRLWLDVFHRLRN